MGASKNQRVMGEVICRYRKEKGLTQKQLAEIIGVTNKAISKWETGDGYPDIELIPALADTLGITIDEMFGRQIRSENFEEILEEAEEKSKQVYKGHLFKITKIKLLQVLCSYALVLGLVRFIEVILWQTNVAYLHYDLIGAAFLIVTAFLAYKEYRDCKKQ